MCGVCVWGVCGVCVWGVCVGCVCGVCGVCVGCVCVWCVCGVCVWGVCVGCVVCVWGEVAHILKYTVYVCTSLLHTSTMTTPPLTCDAFLLCTGLDPFPPPDELSAGFLVGGGPIKEAPKDAVASGRN